MDARLRRLVEEAIAGEPTWLEASARLRPHMEDEPLVDGLPAVVAALDYGMVLAYEVERRERYGAFVPMFELPDRIYPPLLSNITDEVLDLWADVHDTFDDPLIRSRFGDLLWQRRFKANAFPRVRATVEAYLSLSDRTSWIDIERAEVLMRALELAVSLSTSDLVTRAVERVNAAAQTSMAASEPEPGVALHLIAALWRLPAKWQPATLDDLLATAAGTYADDPFSYEVVVNLQLSRVHGEQAQVTALAQEKIRSWRAHAGMTTSIVRIRHLQHALEIARGYGLRQEIEELRTELQRVAEAGLDLHTVDIGLTIPQDEVDTFFDSLFRGVNLVLWLQRFALQCPITENRDEAQRLVQERMRQFPLQHLVTRLVVDEYGVPVRLIQTAEEHRDYALTEHETYAINFWAAFAAEALDEMAARRRPSVDELTDHFITPVIDATLARRIATAIDHFWNGWYEESLFILLPRLETVIRELCRQVGLVVVREPIGSHSGGFLTLGDLLPSLRGKMGNEGHRIYLMRLLADPLSINLRNKALHGLIAEADRQNAALAIHAACLLQLYHPMPVDAEANS